MATRLISSTELIEGALDNDTRSVGERLKGEAIEEPVRASPIVKKDTIEIIALRNG